MTAPPIEADHFHMFPPMPCTSAYSTCRYSIVMVMKPFARLAGWPEAASTFRSTIHLLPASRRRMQLPAPRCQTRRPRSSRRVSLQKSRTLVGALSSGAMPPPRPLSGKVPSILDLFCPKAKAVFGVRERMAHEPILPTLDTIRRNAMIKRAIFLAVGASALFMTAASAAPLSANVTVAPESNIQNVRMICNENGRCWRQRVNAA